MKNMKRIVITLVLAVLCVLFLTGCGCSVTSTPAKELEAVARLLPPGYTNLKPLGNKWFSYDLEVGGKQRIFMVRSWSGSHGEVGITVTELK
jgi:hypothetical protein